MPSPKVAAEIVDGAFNEAKYTLVTINDVEDTVLGHLQDLGVTKTDAEILLMQVIHTYEAELDIQGSRRSGP